MKFTAVGDILIQKVYDTSYEGARQIKDYIAKGDVRFFNLETTLNRVGECCGSQFSGGSYLRAEPEALDTAASYGFNAVSFNNNHVLDFFYTGLLNTLELVEKSGLAHCGVGRDMPAAAKPAYIQTPDGTVAVISVNTTFEPSAMAGKPSPEFPGRPGINGLRAQKYVSVTPKQMEQIRAIGEKSMFNASKDITRKEGYYPELPDGVYEMGSVRFEVGETTATVTHPNNDDLKRILDSVEEAKKNADYVIISIHSHEIEGDQKENPAQFFKEFAHICIDNGVNAIVGHGPHLIRPIEIYKNRPIFYSLGDFVLQLNDIAHAPAEFFEKHGLTTENTVKELLDKRSDHGKKGLMYERKMFETFIPYWESDSNGDLSYLELMPVELGFDLADDKRGIPYPAADLSFIDRLADISAPYGTKFSIKDGKVVCEF